MTTYAFKVVIEPDDDRWHAYCPALVERGGATWGAIPEAEAAPSGSGEVFTEPLVAVTI